MQKLSHLLFCLCAATALFLTSCGTMTSVSTGNYRVIAHRPHDPSKVEVKLSLATQNLYVIEPDKEGDRLLMAVQGNVGKPGAATPTGNFTIYNKEKHRRRQSEPDRGYPMAYWCEFAPAYGFHEGFVHPAPHTHGCVRLHREAAARLFALVSIGTKVNMRTPEVMTAVQEQVESHYRSDIVDKVRRAGGILQCGDITVRLAKQFGFCYGVERAIDLAYAARKVFKDRRLFIVGEIIHNPEVNHQIASLGIKNLTGKNKQADISDLGPEDVVIVPAFGTELSIQQQIKDRGCQVVDTTCGDVMSVWKRVRKYASESATSIIHGKAEHEETKATSSRALGDGSGHYVVVLTLADTDYVCEYIRHGGDKQAFLEKFDGAHSAGFDPDIHLRTVGVANQTTMLRGETEEVQRRIRQAIVDRDGAELGAKNFRFFDTICGATQERQDALNELLNVKMDLLLVVGGYNSSNTSHLAEMGEEKLPTYFVLNASRLVSANEIKHYDLHEKREVVSHFWLPNGPAVIGITAGASCPNNLIEETLIRLF